VRFDPFQSRGGLKIWIDGVASLAPGERYPLGFRVGDNGEYKGCTGHIFTFFEGGTSATDQPPYPITVRFLEGTKERMEQHTIEGYPLPKGGVGIKIVPAIPAD